MGNEIEKAIKILKEGGIVIFPTDTAFGIGCRVDDEKAVERLFKIRKRPKTQAVPVLVDTVKMAQGYVQDIPQEVIDKLIEPYWPGALTVILRCMRVKVPSLVRGGGDTLGVRIPNHPVVRRIIREVGVPILGPSANFHGEKTAFFLKDLDKRLVRLVDFVVGGECTIKQASTVVDCSVLPWKMVREGSVDIQLKKNVILLIDSSSNKEIKVGVRIEKNEYWNSQKIGLQKSQVVLPMIDLALREHKIRFQELKGIEVHTGPGSFTGLRVGIAIANALSFALAISVNNKKIGTFVGAEYQ